MQFLCAPLLGVISDRFGRRPVILIALFGSGLDYIAQAFAPTLSVFYFTRALNGISGASMTVAQSYVADITPPEKRAAAYGMVFGAFGLGFIIGPAMGGWLGYYDLRYPFYAAAALTLINWLYGLFVLPESLPKDRRAPMRWSRTNPVGALQGLRKYPVVTGLAAASFVANLAQFGLHATWALYTGKRYGWDPRMVGFSLMAVGIGSAFVQAFVARKLVPKLGEKRSLLLGFAMSAFAFAGYGLSTQGWMIFAVIAFATIGGIAQPAGQSLISRTVGPTEQGTVQGALTSLTSLAQIIGPLVGSTVFALGISMAEKHGNFYLGTSFFVGSALSVVGLLIAAYALRNYHDHTRTG
jgi:DHA1 family tetracycline resistance protein-like MFS transporter